MWRRYRDRITWRTIINIPLFSTLKIMILSFFIPLLTTTSVSLCASCQTQNNSAWFRFTFQYFCFPCLSSQSEKNPSYDNPHASYAIRWSQLWLPYCSNKISVFHCAILLHLGKPLALIQYQNLLKFQYNLIFTLLNALYILLQKRMERTLASDPSQVLFLEARGCPHTARAPVPLACF